MRIHILLFVFAPLMLGIGPCGGNDGGGTCPEGTYEVASDKCCPTGSKYELGLCVDPSASADTASTSTGSSSTTPGEAGEPGSSSSGTTPVTKPDNPDVPTITSIIGNGPTGLIRDGIRIKGSKFGFSPEVSLDTTRLTVVSAVDTEIEAALPATVLPGDHKVSVRTQAGQATQSVSILKGEKGDPGPVGPAGKDAVISTKTASVVKDILAGNYKITDSTGVGSITCPVLTNIASIACRCNGLSATIFSCRPTHIGDGIPTSSGVGGCYGSGSIDVTAVCLSQVAVNVYAPAPDRDIAGSALNDALRETRERKFLHDGSLFMDTQ